MKGKGAGDGQMDGQITEEGAGGRAAGSKKVRRVDGWMDEYSKGRRGRTVVGGTMERRLDAMMDK
eukprot:scaffold258239_cov19-Prasinocladus_malaysianus.AAC.1